MSKLLVVFGATGQQGGSIISYALEKLSSEYRVRAITRDPLSKKAQELKEAGAEVVKGDAEDKASLNDALRGADIVFSMSSMGMDGTVDEFEIGKSIADSAVEAGAKYIIWSTLPNVRKVTGGELQHVVHFDKKAQVEAYIRELPIKSAFYSPGFFLQNFITLFKPQPAEDGYSIYSIMKPTSLLPCIDVVGDSGKFVGTILSSPDEYEGKTIYGALGLYSFEDIVQIISKTSGKNVTYVQIPEETFKSFLPPPIAQDLTEMFLFHEKFGYYGPDFKSLVEGTLKSIDFVPTSAEDFFKSNKIAFD